MKRAHVGGIPSGRGMLAGAMMFVVAAAACDPTAEMEGLSTTGPAPSTADPGEAEVFAPGVISDHREQWRITFTANGKTAYFTTSDFSFPFTRKATIYVSHYRDGGWTPPEVAPFSGQYSDIDPFITPDGQRLYFSSIRPVEGEIRGDIDIWMVERTPSGWSDPIHMGSEVNSPADELYPSATASGTLYFASGPMFPQPGKHWDIYRAERSAEGFAPRERLSGAINTAPSGSPGEGLTDAWEFNPEISPDGRTLMFASLRPGGYGQGDLYVSHLLRGEWSQARNLGPKVNTEYDEYHPTLSRDRRFLYFVRRIFRRDPFLFVRGDFYRIETKQLDLF